MGNRVDLQAVLEGLLQKPNVYYQPPESIKMAYPCIRYELADIFTLYADNAIHTKKAKYHVIVMDFNPDSQIPNEVLKLPFSKFDRHYVSNNLHHFSFNLYF